MFISQFHVHFISIHFISTSIHCPCVCWWVLLCVRACMDILIWTLGDNKTITQKQFIVTITNYSSSFSFSLFFLVRLSFFVFLNNNQQHKIFTLNSAHAGMHFVSHLSHEQFYAPQKYNATHTLTHGWNGMEWNWKRPAKQQQNTNFIQHISMICFSISSLYFLCWIP